MFDDEDDFSIDLILNQIQFHMVEEKYDQDIEFISAGDECENMMFISQGRVEIEVHDEDGCNVIAVLKQGDIIGAKSVIEGSVFDFAAIAAKTVRVFKLPKSYFDENMGKV